MEKTLTQAPPASSPTLLWEARSIADSQWPSQRVGPSYSGPALGVGPTGGVHGTLPWFHPALPLLTAYPTGHFVGSASGPPGQLHQEAEHLVSFSLPISLPQVHPGSGQRVPQLVHPPFWLLQLSWAPLLAGWSLSFALLHLSLRTIQASAPWGGLPQQPAT